MVVLPLVEATGAWFTVRVATAVSVHPPALVTVTV